MYMIRTGRESELAETVLEEDTAVSAEDETLEEGVSEKEIPERKSSGSFRDRKRI